MADRYSLRVARGVEFLDKVYPGWDSKIALGRLAMETCDKCILGQLYGDYYRGFREILVSFPATIMYKSADFGFTLYDHEQNSWKESQEVILSKFRELADTWRDAIRGRLENK